MINTLVYFDNCISRFVFSNLYIIRAYSALEGVCHQLGTYYAFDIGAPTYFRKSITSDGGTGENKHWNIQIYNFHRI